MTATVPPASSSSCPAPAPTSRPCSTPPPIRRTAPGSWLSVPTATTSRAWRGRPGRGPDLRGAGRRLRHPRALGPRAGRRRWPSFEPDLVVSAGFMKLLGETFLAAFAAARQHAPGAVPGLPRHPWAARRPRVRREGHRRHPLRRRRGRRHRADRRAGRRPVAEDDDLETAPRADQGRRARHARRHRRALAREGSWTAAGFGSGPVVGWSHTTGAGGSPPGSDARTSNASVPRLID